MKKRKRLIQFGLSALLVSYLFLCFRMSLPERTVPQDGGPCCLYYLVNVDGMKGTLGEALLGRAGVGKLGVGSLDEDLATYNEKASRLTPNCNFKAFGRSSENWGVMHIGETTLWERVLGFFMIF